MKKATILIFLCPMLSSASVSDVMGLGARNASLGLANGPTNAGAFHAKTNPAGLTRGKKIELLGGYSYSVMDLAGVSNSSAQGLSGIASDGFNAEDAGDVQNMDFAMAFALGKKLSLGVVGLLPAESFLKVYAFTENEVTYLHFNDRQQRPEIYTSFGYALTPSFSLGAGLFYSVTADGNVQLGLSQEDAEARFFLDVRPSFIPLAGVHFQTETASKTFKLGAMVRGEQKANTKLLFDLRMGVVGLGTLPFHGETLLVPFYDPAQVVLGGGFLDSDYEIYGSVEVNFWSRYRSPVVEFSGDISLLTNGPKDSASSSASTGNSTGKKSTTITLQDTYSYRLGGELKRVLSLGKTSMGFRAGLEYHTSALPDRPTSLTVVDSDRWAISSGIGLKVPRLGAVIERPFEVDFTFKYIQLLEKTLSLGDRTVDIRGDMATFFAGVGLEF